MVEEQRCNSSSGGRGVGGGRSCKKPKQDKIPQRGLGVAELERILQDQQRNSGTGNSTSTGTTTAATSSLVPPPLPLPLQPPPVIASEFSSSFRTNNAISNLLSHTPVPPLPSVPANSRALHGRPTGVAAGGYDGISILPYALQNDPIANPIWWYSQQQHRRPQQQQQQQQQHQQQHQQPMVMANTSFLPSSSGVNHLQMEPPSNQINHSSNFTLPPWPEEERICGIKRPWPFPFENTSAGGPCRIPTFSKPEDIPPPFGLDSFKFEQRNIACRENNHLSSSGAYQVDYRSSCNLRHEKIPRENGIPNDSSLLTLGPLTPSIPTALLGAKSKQPMLSHPPNYREIPDFSLSSVYTSMDEATFHSEKLSQAPFYEFLPTGPISQETSSSKQGEAEDNIDLSLKL